MAQSPMLKGLFDRPIKQPDLIRSTVPQYTPDLPVDGTFIDAFGDVTCAEGWYQGIDGLCYPLGDQGNFPTVFPIATDPGILTGVPTQTQTQIIGQGSANVTVNNTISLTEQAVQPIATAIQNAIDANTQIIKDQSAAVEKAITSEIQEDTDAITSGIKASATNLGDEVTITTTALAASTAATVGTVAKSINDEITAVKGAITPILTSISGFINQIDAEVQSINDTFIQPLLTLYNSTIGTISTLTAAIETDLKEGISGLLQIPGQLAQQLGSFDASLQRTVEQLGTVNKETITTSIDYLGQQFPAPFSAAMNTALSGKSLANSLSTTFGGTVALSSESLSQVSAEAISGLGGLLRQLLNTVSNTFNGELSEMHANWKSVESMFVGLLDGALTLLTTLTAMGALASPLIQAAEQDALSAVPITKLDPATVIEAMKRDILSTEDGLKELRAKGIDATRSQLLIDLGIFLADANMALDWWYRGIISEPDLIDNLQAHGFATEDITAYREGSIQLPTLPDLLRWMNFGLITQDQFTQNAKILRYDDAQITAILSTYQDRESAQTLSQLNGLLSVSDAGWLHTAVTDPVPNVVSIAGTRGGLHPDLVRYIWLSHWKLPEVNTFMQAYFRGIRTLTELQQRMQIDNIPPELWDDLIRVNQSLIPFRSIPSFVSKGMMTMEQAQTELAAHGFDLAHQQIILKAVTPAVNTTNATAVSAIHTLSIGNAKTLWEEQAITSDQYVQVLIAHGYDAATAALQLQADSVALHIKQQKQEIADLTSQVESGTMTVDDAVTQLQKDGFTQSQISKFTLQIAKYSKISVKIPSLADLSKFLKAQLITIDDYKQALIDSGWSDPWLTAFLGLVTIPDTTSTDTTAS